MRETFWWFLFMIAGVILFVVLGVHIVGIHMSALFGVSYEQTLSFAHVSARSSQLIFLIFYLVFLVTALYHGTYGIRSILLEFNWSMGKEKAITWALALISLLFLAIGTWAAVASYIQGKGAPV